MSGMWGCSSLRAQRYEVLLRHLQKQVPLCQQRPSEGAAAENHRGAGPQPRDSDVPVGEGCHINEYS